MHRLKIPHKKGILNRQDLSVKAWLAVIVISWSVGLSILPNPPAGTGLIMRHFDPPKTQFGAGHRGIDIQATPDELVTSPITGKVHYVGHVVDRPVLTIATATALITFEPIESLLISGMPVRRGEIIGWVGTGGHCDQVCLHIGVRRIYPREYIDPLPYLLGIPRLLPTKP